LDCSAVAVRVVILPDGYRAARSLAWIDLRPIDSFTPSEIFEEMFIPRGDFWDRSWMFCDHVGSLVNIVALGFALFRRTGDAVAFDAVMKTWILDSETGEARRSEAEKPQPQQPPLFYQLSHTLLLQQARFGAAGSSELRRTGRAKYCATTTGKYQVTKEGWSLVTADDLTKQPLRKLQQQEPAKAAELKILRLSEVKTVQQ
jgi:hypothetical protein